MLYFCVCRQLINNNNVQTTRAKLKIRFEVNTTAAPEQVGVVGDQGNGRSYQKQNRFFVAPHLQLIISNKNKQAAK